MLVSLIDATLDLDRRRVVRRDGAVRLTKAEQELLAYLIERTGRSVTRSDLERDVLGYRPGIRTRALDSLVYRLRQKIERDVKHPDHLVSVRGTGYRFELAPEAGAASPEPDRRDAVAFPLAGSFVGHADLLAHLPRRLREGRWVTLVGPGGIGKSRLAQEIAARWSPRLVVQVEAPGDDAAVVRAVGARLRASGLSADTLARALAQQDGLLLWIDAVDLDPSVGERIADWLASAPALHVLVSTRKRFRRPGEAVVDVPPLDDAETRGLFELRARDVRFDVQLPPTANAGWDALVRMLGGLPLAIELASSRLRTLDFASLVARLEMAPHALVAPPGSFAPRHASLAAVLGESVDALDDTQRNLLVEATVFGSAFGLDAAEAVLSPHPDKDVLQVIESLVDQGLLRTTEVLGPLRFSLPASIKSLVAPSLDPGHPVHARHADWWLSRSPPQAPDPTWPVDPLLHGGVEDLRRACLQALDAARTNDAVRLFHGLCECLHDHDPTDLLGLLLDRILALPELADHDRREVWFDHAMTALRHDRVEDAKHAMLEARAGASPAQDVRMAIVWAQVLVTGRDPAAEPAADDAIRIATQQGVPLAEGIAHGIAADIASNAGRPVDAQRHLEQCSQLFATGEVPLHMVALTEGRWATFLQNTGDIPGALRRRERAVEVYHRNDQPYDEARQRISLAFLCIRVHDIPRAREHAGAALRLAQRVATRMVPAYALSALGFAAYRAGELEQAERCYSEAWELATTVPDPVCRTELCPAVGALQLDLGMPGLALEWLDRARPELDRFPWLRPNVEVLSAEALGRLGRRPEMEQALARVTASWDQGPSDSMSQHNLWVRTGLAWAAVGEDDKARQALEQAEAIGAVGTHPWAVQFRERLRSRVHRSTTAEPS